MCVHLSLSGRGWWACSLFLRLWHCQSVNIASSIIGIILPAKRNHLNQVEVSLHWSVICLEEVLWGDCEVALTLMRLLFSATAAVPALSHPLSQKPAGQRGKCSSVTYLRCFKRQLSAAVPPVNNQLSQSSHWTCWRSGVYYCPCSQP